MANNAIMNVLRRTQPGKQNYLSDIVQYKQRFKVCVSFYYLCAR